MLVAEDVHANVAKVELLEELATVFDCSEGLVGADVSKGISLKFKCS